MPWLFVIRMHIKHREKENKIMRFFIRIVLGIMLIVFILEILCTSWYIAILEKIKGEKQMKAFKGIMIATFISLFLWGAVIAFVYYAILGVI